MSAAGTNASSAAASERAPGSTHELRAQRPHRDPSPPTPMTVCTSSSSAAAVPACSATSSALPHSASRFALDQPKSHGIRIVCAEEETGSNSVGPCSAPSSSASRSVSRDRTSVGCIAQRVAGSAPGHLDRRRALLELLRTSTTATTTARDPVDNAYQHQRKDRVVDVLEA